MTTTTGIHQETPSLSRFHAIVAAKPLHGSGPPVIERHILHEPWTVRFHTGKRKRDSPAGVVVSANKAVKRDHDGSNLSREPTKLYHDREELLRSLKTSFSLGPDVDFHGMYELSDSNVTHKQRIQTVTHGIWKTTGYRFTVKDHPQVTNGHKTRFWCSQDEAHRSKSSRAARKAQGSSYAPRVTSGGEVMAKARYPCRSRLLISSRDSDKPGIRVITVRMHHHFAHEPYVDSNLPPEVAQGIWESFGWIDQSGPPIKSSREMGTSSSSSGVHLETEEGTSSCPSSSDEDHDSPTPTLDEDVLPTMIESFPTADNSGSLTDIYYHDRMRAHIKNLREFCDGLEYQLQFNDYRMLNVLEREGGSFLNLVEDCLRKEGRLLSVGRPEPSVYSDIIIPSSSAAPDNPGINPEALSR